MFQRILVANRGEIALRVIRACHDLGVQAAAVFSTADRDAPYLKIADDVCIGLPTSADSYLQYQTDHRRCRDRQRPLLIHPVYGFLSETLTSLRFAGRATSSSSARPKMHAQARQQGPGPQDGQSRGVPVVPGPDGLITDEEKASTLARRWATRS
ncbi:MAG: biotin carboxylase N-terminal domain-containing protein [Gemmataceae bacterium]